MSQRFLSSFVPRALTVPAILAAGLLATAALGSFGCSRSEAARKKPAPEATTSATAPGASAAAVAAAQAVTPTLLGQATDAAGAIRLVRGEELASHLRTTKSRGTIVNVWASWCGPCRRELPMLIGLRTSLAAQGIELVFVSVDEQETEPAALAFFREQGGQAPIYVAERPLGPFKEALSPRWRGMLPATFLFDAHGGLRYLWGGPVYDNELLPIVDGFLAGKNIDGESNFGLAPGQDTRP